MPLSEIETLLKRTMGLDASTIGTSTVKRAIRQRQEVRGTDDLREYWKCLQSSDQELQELIETVVVPETWFFRDKEAFDALSRLVNEEWLSRHPKGTLRVLSVPCSTGEEPYTMAMALLDTGLPAERLQIDAMDISARVIKMAHRAVYRPNSFRGSNLGFRDRYFEPVEHGHHLCERVHQRVRFRQGNLLDPDSLGGHGLYDVIFCRNLLIYFDRPTQDRVIQLLEPQLAPKGFLFVGAAETGIVLNHNFVSVQIPFAFAFRKAGSQLVATERANHAQQEERDRRPRNHLLPLPRTAARPPLTKTPAAKLSGPNLSKQKVNPVLAPTGTLEAAAKLADQGQLAEAAAMCQTHLKDKGPSADVFFLLGLIQDATASPDKACQYYRKALYMDPNHYETLVHLALLLEKLGDAPGGQALHNRACRVKEKTAA